MINLRKKISLSSTTGNKDTIGVIIILLDKQHNPDDYLRSKTIRNVPNDYDPKRSETYLMMIQVTVQATITYLCWCRVDTATTTK